MSDFESGKPPDLATARCLKTVYGAVSEPGRADLADEGGIEQLREVSMGAEPDQMLRQLIDLFCSFWASNRIVMRRLHGMVAIDPEFAR